MYMRRLNVSVNSDDLPMFGADITDELLMLNEKLNYSLYDPGSLTMKEIEVSFLENAGKKKYTKIIDNYLNAI
jgi:adenosine deaminase